MTDPAAHTTYVDALAETVRRALRPGMTPAEALAALDSLTDLAATARERDGLALLAATRRVEVRAAEADRDRALADRFSLAKRYTDENDRLARRVAELEAALRDCQTSSPHGRVGAIARAALAGDEGGA